MSVTAHCLVKNEENFVWYAIQSVLPYVDKILAWDTGSTDKTVEIIKSINSPKIEFEEKGPVDKHSHTLFRQQMLEKTTTDWFMVLDGDEVWPESQIKFLVDELLTVPLPKSAVLVNFILCVGDIYHYSRWGDYNYSWGLQTRAFPKFYRKKAGFHWSGDYAVGDSVYDSANNDVITQSQIHLSSTYLFHMSLFQRSTRDSDVFDRIKKRSNHLLFSKIGHGVELPKSVNIPEVFTNVHPEFIHDYMMSLSFINSFTNFIKKYAKL